MSDRNFYLRLVLILLGTGTFSGCNDVGSALGRSPAEARQHAAQLTSALGGRFGPVVAADDFDDVRSRFARSALIPSRLFGDSTIWTAFAADGRALRLGGRPEAARYLLGFRDLSKLSGRVGETRRFVDLRRLSGNEYEWAVRDELIVGGASPDQLGETLSLLLRAAAESDPASARMAIRSAFPRTATSLGRLISLERVTLLPRSNGTRGVTIEFALDPGRIEKEFPDYSRFLDRYLSRTRISITAMDTTGVDWWRANLAENRMTLELAVSGSALTPLEGPPRRMPNSLRTRVDAATRVRIFGVGFSGLDGDVSLRRAADEKSFTVRFPREPKWHLPLLVEQFLRAPLGRPFEGEGASLGFSVTRRGASTVVARDYRIAVEESAILRWIGGLGSTALSDFRLRAEAQHDQFIGEAFAALGADLDALIR